jgi:hypothetical protein
VAVLSSSSWIGSGATIIFTRQLASGTCMRLALALLVPRWHC